MRGALEAVDRGACEMDLVRESPLASALCTYTGGLLGRDDGRWKASPRRERPFGARAASWADLSEDPDCPAALQGLLLPGLCPTQELQARPSANRPPSPEGPGAPRPGCGCDSKERWTSTARAPPTSRARTSSRRSSARIGPRTRRGS
ncbi:unnamed protein product [Prorocentrum cordatum]|uniref:Uncharacterized protein n=1 Tax=Prorocentrum cordatum TaxID=2364126 RepID=A0ABN9SZM9_9DINO|nr:unnamed protein product [Polarella glacialis]